MPNLSDELSTVKERCLNQYGRTVLVWCGKSVKFELLSNLTKARHTVCRLNQISRQCDGAAATQARLSNDDGDGNENGKKAIGFD